MTAEIRWADNHCHLGFRDDGPSAEELVEEAAEAGVVRLIDVGTTVEHSIRCIEAAEMFADVHATAGVHPHDASDGIAGLEDLLGSDQVVGVGECGLDFHYEHSPRDVQRQVFAAQIGLAHQHDLALVIHTREAWADTFDILGAEGVPERTVFHCFTGGVDEARRALDLGAALSFSGIVTFPSASDVAEAASFAPLDRVAVETDAPYLAPVPNRGKANRPAWVPLVGARVAELRGVGVAEVAAATWRTTSWLYRLPD